MASNRTRAGTFVAQPSGYRAFLPAPLPPDPPIELEGELLSLLSDADIALGRLDGVVKVIPDPEFFVAMYVRREAVLSSQIEGTQSTLEDLLEVELEPDAQDRGDVGEIVNYVAAMNHGLARMHELPLSLRLIGEIRRTQNWIGPKGASLKQATFVPPPVPEMKEALYALEQFLYTEPAPPLLILAGLAHAQFES